MLLLLFIIIIIIIIIIIMRRLVSWINHLPPVCLSTFWKATLNNSWAVGLT